MTEVVHAPAWQPDPVTPPPPATKAYTAAQLADLQTNLMLSIADVPMLHPAFDANGYDEHLHLRNRGDNGATPHGLVSGQWFWTVTLPLVAEDLWPECFAQAKHFGWTHWFLHVPTPPADWYHAIFDTRDVRDQWGPICNRAHAALLAAGLIPVCAGVSTEQPAAPGFDGSQVLVALTDWDDWDTADCQINAVAAAFPKALVYWERPGPQLQIAPKPDACSSVQPTETNGGAWLRSVQQRCPNFVGVFYEVNIWEGIQPCIDEITRCHPFYRDVQEVRGETNTYVLFWEGGDRDEYKTLDDQLQAACPWLHGYASGGTPHPPPPDDAPPVHGGAAGDMIPIDAITFVGGPNIGAWPATAVITLLELRAGSVYVEHTKQDGASSWPDTAAAGAKEPGVDMGPLQYSLGLALNIGGRWYASAPIELWRGLKESGGPIQSQDVKDGTGRGQIQANWFYDGRWTPLNGHQPQPGETIGVFVCAGDARNSVNPVQERSNLVAIPLPADGQTAAYTWTA